MMQAKERNTLERLNRPMGGHVDSVEELTDILVLHQARLMDQGGRAGREVDVGALDQQLILDALVLDDLGRLMLGK